jgi:hypothetical protein
MRVSGALRAPGDSRGWHIGTRRAPSETRRNPSFSRNRPPRIPHEGGLERLAVGWLTGRPAGRRSGDRHRVPDRGPPPERSRRNTPVPGRNRHENRPSRTDFGGPNNQHRQPRRSRIKTEGRSRGKTWEKLKSCKSSSFRALCRKKTANPGHTNREGERGNAGGIRGAMRRSACKRVRGGDGWQIRARCGPRPLRRRPLNRSAPDSSVRRSKVLTLWSI